MKYYFCVNTQNNYILSCDMLRLKFKIEDNFFKILSDFFKELEFNQIVRFNFYESRKLFAFRNLFDVTIVENECSFVIGLGFNSLSSSDFNNCFIEFNPNKTLFDGSVLFEIIGLIKAYTSGFELVRYDFAVDVPIARENVNLIKDLRDYKKNYYIDVKSNKLNNITEYLGKRNSNGFVKLYNKTLEQNLNYDLTRIEITLDRFDYDNFKDHLPQILIYKNLNIFDYMRLNDTDKVLVSLLLENVNKNIYLKMLGRVKQEKIKSIISESVMLDISPVDYFEFIKKTKQIYA